MFDVVYENKILNHNMIHHNMDMLIVIKQSRMIIISIHLKKKQVYLYEENRSYHYQHNLTYQHFLNDWLRLFELNHMSRNRILKNIIDHQTETFSGKKNEESFVFDRTKILPSNIDFTGRSKFYNRRPKDSSIRINHC